MINTQRSAPSDSTPISVGDRPVNDKLRFANDEGFHVELKRRVLEYFESSGLSPRDSPRMYLKTAVLLLWFGASYASLVFAASSWWQGVLMSISLALAMAGIGFSVQHDANHGAYSKYGVINCLMGLTLDMLGASSYVWHWKHNLQHHTYTNLSGADADISFSPIARLSPAQARYRLHRLQQFYMWPLYSLLFPKWNLVDDFKDVWRARIAGARFPRPHGLRLMELVSGKVLFFAWAFALPLLFHPWWQVIAFYTLTSMVLGFVLAIVFQVAHCVEDAQFPDPAENGRLPDSWAVHQTQTTVNFAPRNRLLTWYVGGLNFQIEHHLFPRVCHVHYPRIANIVEAACAEFGVRYTAYPSFRGAIASHWRWLRRMGMPITAAAASTGD